MRYIWSQDESGKWSSLRIGPPTYIPETCGTQGPDTKYQDAYRVLGNQRRVKALCDRYSTYRDRGYESNVRYINLVLLGYAI